MYECAWQLRMCVCFTGVGQAAHIPCEISEAQLPLVALRSREPLGLLLMARALESQS